MDAFSSTSTTFVAQKMALIETTPMWPVHHLPHDWTAPIIDMSDHVLAPETRHADRSY